MGLRFDALAYASKQLGGAGVAATCGRGVGAEDHVLKPLLSSTPLVKVGVLSYGIYLLHMPVRIVMDAVLRKLDVLAPTSLFASTVVVTLVVAQLSYTLFESRFLKLKDRFNA